MAIVVRFPLPLPRIAHPWAGVARVARLTLGKSRMRESRKPGSVWAKAEWLSCLTMTFCPVEPALQLFHLLDAWQNLERLCEPRRDVEAAR
jgi:hypothetical protein